MSSLPKTVTRQRRDCDLNPGPSAPESSTLSTRLPSHLPEFITQHVYLRRCLFVLCLLFTILKNIVQFSIFRQNYKVFFINRSIMLIIDYFINLGQVGHTRVSLSSIIWYRPKGDERRLAAGKVVANRRSGVTNFNSLSIRLRAHGIRKADKHPANLNTVWIKWLRQGRATYV